MGKKLIGILLLSGMIFSGYTEDHSVQVQQSLLLRSEEKVILPKVYTDPGEVIQAHAGEEFLISLPGNFSTGYSWEISLAESGGKVELLDSQYKTSKNDMPGSSGFQIFRFRALKIGTSEIDFIYARPWEPDRSDTRMSFTVVVQEP